MPPGLDEEAVPLTSLTGSERLEDRRGREEKIESGKEQWPSRPHNKFSRVGPAKLCASVILLSAGVIEGHQTID